MLRLGLIAAALMAAGGTSASAADTPWPVELNKLETHAATGTTPAGCLVYMVVTNNDPDPLAQLRLDLVLFATDGVIARRLAVDLGPLPGKGTRVRLFDVTGQPCDGIGKLLINDVLACQSTPATEPPQPATPPASTTVSTTACMDRLAPTSRIAAVTFSK